MHRQPPLLLLLAVLITAVAGCGGGDSDQLPVPGTVTVLNQTDLGMAPRTIEAFFLEPVGAPGTSGNRLAVTIPPGGVVIIGLFPPGLYNATAVLDGGANVTWVDEEILPGEPKNFVVP